jgi:DNA-binding MarR family transcriptional regulator
MANSAPSNDAENTRIVLSLLESVERDGGQTQRRLATELGIALGLVNAYIKRCVKKGLVKVGEAPARRYAYYLTPQGFAEKSRLTVEYFSHSFSFFRQARSDCTDVFATIRARGWNRVLLVGVSDLAEIARICSLESEIEIAAVIDSKSEVTSFVGLPVFATFDDVPGKYDGVVITDLRLAHETNAMAIKRFGAERVLAPRLLGLGSRTRRLEA